MRLKSIDLKFRKTIQVVLIVVLFILQSLILNPQSIYAQTSPLQSLRVSPIINELHLTPGKKTSFTLTIQNTTQAPVGIHAEITGYDVTGEAPIIDQQQSAMTNWTKLSQTDVLLGEKEKKTITVTINTPPNRNQNGYYETIFLTPVLHQQQTASSPIILSRIGVLVLGTVGALNYNDLAKKVSVTNLTPSYKLLNTFPQTVSFTVANKYFTHFDAKPFLTITPLFGKPQTTLLTDKHVLPGSERIWQQQLATQTYHIFYRIHLAVSIGDGKQIYADTWFVVLPFKQLLLILIAALLLYIALFKHHRLIKAVSILLRGK